MTTGYSLDNYLTHMRYDSPVIYQDLILAGGSESQSNLPLSFDGHNVLPVGVRIPFLWNACTCYFSGFTEPQQGQYSLHTETGLYTIAAFIADVYISVNPLLFLGFTRIKVHCGTPDTPVPQVAQRQIEWHLRRTSP